MHEEPTDLAIPPSDEDEVNDVQRFNHVLVFSPTAHDDYKFVPENWRYDDWQPDIVKHHMAQQKRLMAEGKNVQMAVVFDDIIGTFNLKETYRETNDDI